MIRDFDENEKVISVAEMRAADAYTIENHVPGKELMYRASYGVYESFDWEGKRTLIFCGGGNNGGDGYALAMIMAGRGHDVSVVRYSDKLSADGGYYFEKCIEAGVTVMDKTDLTQDRVRDVDVAVDCILGTGFTGEVRGSARSDRDDQFNASMGDSYKRRYKQRHERRQRRGRSCRDQRSDCFDRVSQDWILQRQGR